MNKKQKAILVGMILGDAYLQKTGKQNARIRLEHSEKQAEYLIWKAKQFPEFFQGKPTYLSRFNNKYGKTYKYIRWQSNASPEIGKYQRLFYFQNKKIIPRNLALLFNDPLSLAVWYMDDGYLYHRDKIIYIYLAKYAKTDQQILLKALEDSFGLHPILKTKKRGNLVLIFSVMESNKFLQLIKHYIISSLNHKLLNPVSTEA